MGDGLPESADFAGIRRRTIKERLSMLDYDAGSDGDPLEYAINMAFLYRTLYELLQAKND